MRASLRRLQERYCHSALLSSLCLAQCTRPSARHIRPTRAVPFVRRTDRRLSTSTVLPQLHIKLTVVHRTTRSEDNDGIGKPEVTESIGDPAKTESGRSNMPKAAWYAVHTGRRPGVYSSWSEAEAQVKGFNGLF
ncbi:hypothetical protein BD324DRAFT_504781 [Kockovaella imperatae]|uniref:Ribonuclease H1 N-terminal domain-containing protein n=1 Tax=Kockovaella imperatae TaxID=4999 RepID=A0A1Y1UEN3_9TREE|nr:hypothetical protein BD324DRAFT_504781 [Kockovaella imperatae]ORX36520.1 hypothetical protein BD324DRAFT_504781 [Kockovaella imperatae]